MALHYNEKTGEVEILIERKWISKEEAKEMFPDNASNSEKFMHEDFLKSAVIDELFDEDGNLK